MKTEPEESCKQSLPAEWGGIRYIAAGRYWSRKLWTAAASRGATAAYVDAGALAPSNVLDGTLAGRFWKLRPLADPGAQKVQKNACARLINVI
jgi:hypothetical protein